jgi:hypothetical protein
MTLTAVELPGRRVSLRWDGSTYHIVELTDDLECSVRAEYPAEDYRPGMHVKNDLQIFEDLVSFTLAYVEQPEEFERPEDATEQLEAAWWRTYGESLQMAIEEALND